MFSTSTLGPGDAAPDFELVNQRGEPVRMADFEGRNLVLFFYPKDDTPVCTQEACMFRDNYDAMQGASAAVLGVSSDSPESHQRFASKHGFPFDLLTDADGALRKAFGVPKTLGVLPGRVTFVIDKGGVIRHVTNSQLSAQKHVDEALAALARLTE